MTVKNVTIYIVNNVKQKLYDFLITICCSKYEYVISSSPFPCRITYTVLSSCHVVTISSATLHHWLL